MSKSKFMFWKLSFIRRKYNPTKDKFMSNVILYPKIDWTKVK